MRLGPGEHQTTEPKLSDSDSASKSRGREKHTVDERHVSEPSSQMNPSTPNPRIRNPPKRRDARKTNMTTRRSYKTRAIRKKRAHRSKRAPHAARRSSSAHLSIPKKTKSSGYACTMRSNIGIQNNPANVKQHMRAHHVSDDDILPSAEEMMIAAKNISKNAVYGRSREHEF